MKMRPEHFAEIKAVIAPLDTPERRESSVKRGISDMSYRWGLTYAAGLTPWICDNLYPYLNDDHIDTALRRIVPPINKDEQS